LASDGPAVYQLSRVPSMNEFAVRGYTTLVDGLRLKDDGYRPGTGAYQIEILTPIDATLFAIVKPGERFKIPVHPKYR